MNKISNLLIFLILFTALSSCNVKQSNSFEEIYSDTSLFKTDTILSNVRIDDKQFSIHILRDKYNENLERYSENEPDYSSYSFSSSPVTIVFTNFENEKIVYIKKFEDYYPYFMKGGSKTLSSEGKLYFKQIISAGGSGYRQKNYWVFLDEGKLKFTEIFDSGELSYIIHHKNDNEILVLDGIWGRDDDGHFSNHRYKVTKYIIDDYRKVEVGETEYKYSSSDVDKPITQILSEIKENEPELLSKIDLSDYKN